MRSVSTVLHDYLPTEMTDGERAALREATASGWIKPPLVSTWDPEPPRAWRSVHIRYLERRGLIGRHRYRPDHTCCVQLNRAGVEVRAQEVARHHAAVQFAITGETA